MKNFQDKLTIDNGHLLFDNHIIGRDDNSPGFDKYEFEEEIASGSNGVTYRVKHKLLNVHHVIKIYFPKDNEDYGINKAIYEAIKNANTVLNGVIAVVFDAGMYEFPVRIVYSIMECVSNFCTLKQFKAQREGIFSLRGKFDFSEKKNRIYVKIALNIATSFLSTILKLYENGITHGDLNGGNVLWIMDYKKIEDYLTSYSGDCALGTLNDYCIKLIDMGTSELSEVESGGKLRDTFFIFDTVRSLLSVVFEDDFKNWFNFNIESDDSFQEIIGVPKIPIKEIKGEKHPIEPQYLTCDLLRLLCILTFAMGYAEKWESTDRDEKIRLDQDDDPAYLWSLMHSPITNYSSEISHNVNRALMTSCSNHSSGDLINWNRVWNSHMFAHIDSSILFKE